MRLTRHQALARPRPTCSWRYRDQQSRLRLLDDSSLTLTVQLCCAKSRGHSNSINYPAARQQGLSISSISAPKHRTLTPYVRRRIDDSTT